MHAAENMYDPEYVLERSGAACTDRGGILRSRYVGVSALFLTSPVQPV